MRLTVFPSSRAARASLPWLLLLLAFLSTACASGAVGAQTASSAIYGRSDSNATTVWAPRVRAAATVGEAAGVEATYSFDAWTGASIDIVTAATDAVSEVRHEVTAGTYYEFSDVTLGGGYRYSTENDYWSHGGVLNTTFDLAENNTTLGVSVFGSTDLVGRAGNPDFLKPQRSIGARASWTQVIDVKSLIALSVESTAVSGYQSSPYRFVGVGGDGLCAGTADLCIPESHPGQRLRSALIARARRALSTATSLGFEYRYYFDDWGVQSHTLGPDFAWVLSEHDTLNLGYRYYTQSDADFYRARYLQLSNTTRYVTRDRELSTLYSNRLSLGYEHDFPLNDEGMVLEAALRSGLTRYVYRAFVGLDSVNAIEGTFLLALQFK